MYGRTAAIMIGGTGKTRTENAHGKREHRGSTRYDNFNYAAVMPHSAYRPF